MLLPPDLRNWLPEGHLALFVNDVVEELDLSEIKKGYERNDSRGRPSYHPAMMTKLLVYGYCTGKYSSRKIEKATHEDIGFRVLACNEHPDHASIAEFRKKNLVLLAELFVQVLSLCKQAGLVKLGHVAIDGTKVRANASKHKAMSYQRMLEKEKQLAAEVAALLKRAEETDQAEDREHGKGKRGDELPEELRRRDSRLAKIREAKAALEREARERAEEKNKEREAKIEARNKAAAESGTKPKGRMGEEVNPDEAKPEGKAQKNFTDPESKIMRDGVTKSFEQSYNAQAAVDAESQVIVGAAITQDGNDKQQLVPMIEEVRENLGKMPDKVSADAGYFSEPQIMNSVLSEVDLYVPPDRGTYKESVQQTELVEETINGAEAEKCSEMMKKKLRTEEGIKEYKKRKQTVEPVFGQIKECRGFRRFSFRGLKKVTAEWAIVCLSHNLLKLFKSGFQLA
jgi:transposase